MSIATIGRSANFHVLFVDGDNNPVTVVSATIEVFTFSGTTKQVLVTAGTPMSAVPSEAGRYVYSYVISSNYNLDPNIYASMKGTDSFGTVYLVEQQFDIFEGSGEIVQPPPPADPQSHWNTNDGENGAQGYVSSTGLSFTSAYVPTPSGGEGTPFAVGTTGGSVQNRVTKDTSLTITSGGVTTGFGGDSTMKITVYDADGATPLEEFITPALSANGTHTSISGAVVLTLSNYDLDNEGQYKAKASIAIDLSTIFASASRDGGRIDSIVVEHTVDSATDGSGTYSFTMSGFFVDTQPTSPSFGGVVFAENQTVVRYLSGIAYYDVNSTFEIDVLGIDQLNRNTARSNSNLSVVANNIDLPSLNHSPFGTGSANFTGWSSNQNVDGVGYSKTDWKLTRIDYRKIKSTISATVTVRDTWGVGQQTTTNLMDVLIDTFVVKSQDRYEPFDDENKRMESDYVTPWNSQKTLVNGEALVHNSRLQVPHTDWSPYRPTTTNPDYRNLPAAASYYRNFPADNTTFSYSSLSISISGTFLNGLEQDLENDDLQIFVRRFDSNTGGSGTTAHPLLVHGQAYNNTLFDDGVTNGHIRELVSGNTVICTFGGSAMKGGVHVEIKIANSAIVLNNFSVSF